MEQTAKILIVDDNAQIRSTLRGILEGQEDLCIVGEAADGIEALDKIAQFSPDDKQKKSSLSQLLNVT